MRQELTALTGNRLDFFNIGGLAAMRTRESIMGLWTHYTWRELFIRNGMVAASVVLGLWGFYSANSETSPPLLRGVVAGSLGFFVLHTIAVLPTIHRRNQIKMNTTTIISAMEKDLAAFKCYVLESENRTLFQRIIERVKQINQYILKLPLPVQKRGDAVKNLLTILHLVKAMDSKTKEMIEMLKENELNDMSRLGEFWDRTDADIVRDIESSLQVTIRSTPLSQM